MVEAAAAEFPVIVVEREDSMEAMTLERLLAMDWTFEETDCTELLFRVMVVLLLDEADTSARATRKKARTAMKRRMLLGFVWTVAHHDSPSIYRQLDQLPLFRVSFFSNYLFLASYWMFSEDRAAKIAKISNINPVVPNG